MNSEWSTRPVCSAVAFTHAVDALKSYRSRRRRCRRAGVPFSKSCCAIGSSVPHRRAAPIVRMVTAGVVCPARTDGQSGRRRLTSRRSLPQLPCLEQRAVGGRHDTPTIRRAEAVECCDSAPVVLLLLPARARSAACGTAFAAPLATRARSAFAFPAAGCPQSCLLFLCLPYRSPPR